MSRDIFLSLIDPDPDQPRKHFDQAKLEELAQSIKTNGVAVPILVRPVGERFIIVHGERRYKAVTSLGWETIPAEVRDLGPDEARWLSLVENVQRSDLSPIEEAQAYQEALGQGITQTALGERIGKTQSYIAQKLRLLKLPGEVQSLLNDEIISEGHARQLLKTAHQGKQSELAQRTVDNKWSVKELTYFVDCERFLVDPPPNNLTAQDMAKTMKQYAIGENLPNVPRGNEAMEVSFRMIRLMGKLLKYSREVWEDECFPVLGASLLESPLDHALWWIDMIDKVREMDLTVAHLVAYVGIYQHPDEFLTFLSGRGHSLLPDDLESCLLINAPITITKGSLGRYDVIVQAKDFIDTRNPDDGLWQPVGNTPAD